MTTADSLDESFRSRVASWYAEYNLALERSSDGVFEFTDYFKRLDPVWAAFDELEKFRIVGGFPKSTWYKGMEARRKTFDESKKWQSKSSVLTADDWLEVPLGVILEHNLREPVCAGQQDVARALARWHRFHELITENSEFQRSLSYSQRISWTLLNHWWLAVYQDPSLSKAAITQLEAVKASPNKVKYYHDEPHLDEKSFAQSRNSVYNSTMYTLFNTEFNPYFWSNHFKVIYLMGLRRIRSQSNELAAAQRFAYSSYATIKHLRVHNVDSYTASPDKACPWLPTKEGKEYPFYLWEVQSERTVKVADLPFKPEYCCVSHTWGRWRLDTVPIEGVPWLVPKNKRFDIERLPQYLKQIRPQAPFVWLDLFCIPQDRSQKAAEEINRQAIIFQNASRCIAWMNDVNEWTSTLKAFDWVGISFLHATTSSGIYDTEELLKPLFREAQNDSEIFTQKIELAEGESLRPEQRNAQQISIGGRKLAEPAAWFSSLWTLQEAMLCPNLTFVSRDWVPLEDKVGNSIPLDAFFRIINALDAIWDNDKPYQNWTSGIMLNYQVGRRNEDEKWPDGARQLLILGLLTRMENLLESPEPAKLLMVANTRQSTSSRAPAIMSALGITDWYDPKANRHDKEDLVLACYPFAFVREAAAKLGAHFYASHFQKASPKSDTYHHSTKGSMMPFSAKVGWSAPLIAVPAAYGYTTEDHPSVQSWLINLDGTVGIRQAGILASSERDPNDESGMRDFDTEKDGTPIRFIDWAKELPKGMCMFAVSLFKSSGWQKGLLLRGRKKGRFLSTQRLIKCGTFVITDFEFPSATDVNWIVW